MYPQASRDHSFEFSSGTEQRVRAVTVLANGPGDSTSSNILLHQVCPANLAIPFDVLREVRNLQTDTDIVRQLSRSHVIDTKGRQDHSSDWCGRELTVGQQVVPGLIVVDGLILNVRSDQVKKRLLIHLQSRHRRAERQQHRVNRRDRRVEHPHHLRTPFSQSDSTVTATLVAKIVGCPAKSVDASQVNTIASRNDHRCDCEIFVMLVRQHVAIRVGRCLGREAGQSPTTSTVICRWRGESSSTRKIRCHRPRLRPPSMIGTLSLDESSRCWQ